VDAKWTGPIDDHEWPQQLTAHVVDASGDPGAGPRLLGYAVEPDLAAHYSFADIVLLAATGELADPAASRALEVALCFLAATSVAEAPVHAACLSRLCGSEPTATVGVAAIALAEQARFTLVENEQACRQAANDAERESVERLRRILGAIPYSVPALDADLGRTAALLAVLFAVGVRTPEQIALAWTMARLPVAIAEARHVRPAALRDYPMNTPAFEYQSDETPR
jgi:hypothetical protein